MSKPQLDQLIETLNNFIYSEEKQGQSTNSNTCPYNISDLGEADHSYENMPSLNLFFKSKHMQESPETKPLNNSNTTSESSEDDLMMKKLDLTINMLFKIEKLIINFLADVEKPNQEVAELELKAFKLAIKKNKKHITTCNMSLMSLNLVDKLIKPSDEKRLIDSYLLTSCFTESCTNENLSHNCKSMKENSIKTKYKSRLGK
jgi:hypothetical protein